MVDSHDSRPYTRRVVDDELDELLADLPAIAIDGAKGVGKTATAVQRAASLFALDRPGGTDLLRAAPDRLTSAPAPVVLDEWQKYTPSWDVVRRAVDEDPRPGRFLLTGSASPRSPGTHSGAGRIVSIRMRPLSLAERGVGVPTVSVAALLSGRRPEVAGETEVDLDTYVAEILAGGFPGMRRGSPRARRAALRTYVERIVDREFEDAGHEPRNPALLRRWLRAYAAATSTTASFERIRDAATAGQGDKPPRSTTVPYRDTLKRIWISDPVPAWLPTTNAFSRLAASPKHHLADPALAAALLDADEDLLLSGRDAGPPVPRDGTLLGGLFESLVALDLRVYAQAAEATVGHLRTGDGAHEVDFIVTGRGRRSVAFEVKLAADVQDADVRHLLWLRDRMGGDLVDAVVVTTGRDAYRRRDGVAVVPAALLGP
ncbi:ATP-binding protein [Cellulomonas bogoriensis]|uniref:ATPase AAA n=1 Tax=Cellulomonas bogoriensis 69B4 = DSM 16987 TaxID=1386082 RepID=A0A0A0C1A4_9CELL|nr:ATP-binding protein [Cellulomonas bogoriensis]KGM14423.1 ATPase AAA [Cellulomonas bogoriensis 69B4 = DSM 16987]